MEKGQAMATTKNDHSDCQEYLRQISDYIDGELSPDLCAKLEEHLSGCNHCMVVVNTLKRTIELYQEEENATSLPAEAKKRLYSRLSLDDFLK
jgi:anti-sigma factor (TIGR02949 family)